MARTLPKKEQEYERKLEEERCCTIFCNDPQILPANKILAIRALTTEIEYLVQWKGYSKKYNEWVAEDAVTIDLKKEFSLERKAKNDRIRQKNRELRLSSKTEPHATATSPQQKEYEKEDGNESSSKESIKESQSEKNEINFLIGFDDSMLPIFE